MTAWNDTPSARPAHGARARAGRCHLAAGGSPELGVTVVQLRQRRRGVAQADRFQERPGAVLAAAHQAVRRWPTRTASRGVSWRPRYVGPVGRRAGTAPSSCRSFSPGRSPGPRRSSSLSTQGISAARARPANLETGLQLLNLNFTAPGDDPEAFGLIKRQPRSGRANRVSNPNARLRRKALGRREHR